MTEQTGGQPPAGWYPDGTGQVRYWDGAAWTEHVQPAQPEVPAPAPAAPAAPVAEAAPAAAAAQPTPAVTYGATPVAEEPFYKKPAALAVIGAVLLLVVGGAAFALIGGSDDDSSTSASPGTTTSASAAPSAAPTTATQTYQLNCEPTSKIEGANAPYPFNLTLTVTPTEISLSSDNSIKNTGPTVIEAGAYRFDATVTVNGTPLTLEGPTNLTQATGTSENDTQPIFKTTEYPLVAKAASPATAGATPTVVLQDVWFNQITGSGTPVLTDIFDSRCNTSPQPNASPLPIGLSVPPAAGGTTPTTAQSVTP